jgi:hypothetical protein
VAIRIKSIADPGKVFVFTTCVAGLNPFGMRAIKLLAKLLAQPVAFNALLIKQN